MVLWGFGEAEGVDAISKALKNVLEYPSLKLPLEPSLVQRIYIYTHLSSDIALADLKNLNYELQSHLGIPDLQILNTCHSNLEGKQKVRIFVISPKKGEQVHNMP